MEIHGLRSRRMLAVTPVINDLFPYKWDCIIMREKYDAKYIELKKKNPKLKEKKYRGDKYKRRVFNHNRWGSCQLGSRYDTALINENRYWRLCPWPYDHTGNRNRLKTKKLGEEMMMRMRSEEVKREWVMEMIDNIWGNTRSTERHPFANQSCYVRHCCISSASCFLLFTTLCLQRNASSDHRPLIQSRPLFFLILLPMESTTTLSPLTALLAPLLFTSQVIFSFVVACKRDYALWFMNWMPYLHYCWPLFAT